MDTLFTSPVTWLVLGFILIIIEMLHLSLVLLFFGLSALIVAAVTWAGVQNLTVQLILFAVLGLSGMLIFRKKLQSSLSHSKGISIDQNTAVVLSSDVPAHGEASIQYQGTSWTAKNESDQDLKKGTRTYIHRTEGVKLIIKETPL